MTDTNLDMLVIDSIDDYTNGSSKGSFLLEEGSYDSARVVGWVIAKTEFEGKERKVFRLLWQISDGDKVYNLRGSSWSFSSNEKSTFRIEVSKWFDKTTWPEIVELLIKGGILVKNDDGKSAHFNVDAFLCKYGRLLVEEKTSKKGSKYNVIKSISPVKKKEEFEWGEVPEFLVKGDDVLKYKLVDGVKIHVKESADNVKIDDEPKTEAPEPKVNQVDAKEFLEGKEEAEKLPF